jgi:hypothetical protein
VRIWGDSVKLKGSLLAAMIVVCAILIPVYTQEYRTREEIVVDDEFFFGVSFGGQTAQEAITLIDKVKNYTSLFLINSYDVSTNETALNEVCNYAAQADLSFIVYFDFISRIGYPWHQTWLDTAKERWGDKFLGIHLSDEPGGKQMDTQRFFKNASGYSDAANLFINNISSSNSMIDAKNKSIPTFTSDYALYWWDYLGGYDTVFTELGWGLGSRHQIALCRGAANMQNKDWGAIIVWTYYEPPYLASGQKIYEDMVSAYDGGAKYVVVFNYPTYPQTNPYGILSEEHFEAMEQFWNHINMNPRDGGKMYGEAAVVLPADYGWGMRRNRIWGVWFENETSAMIMENIEKLLSKHGLALDIVYDDERFDFKSRYEKVYFWNATIT